MQLYNNFFKRININTKLDHLVYFSIILIVTSLYEPLNEVMSKFVNANIIKIPHFHPIYTRKPRPKLFYQHEFFNAIVSEVMMPKSVMVLVMLIKIVFIIMLYLLMSGLIA